MLNWTLFQLEKDIGEIKLVNLILYHAKLQEKVDQLELDLFQDQEVQELSDNPKLKKFFNLLVFKIVILALEDVLKQLVTVWKLSLLPYWKQINF